MLGALKNDSTLNTAWAQSWKWLKLHIKPRRNREKALSRLAHGRGTYPAAMAAASGSNLTLGARV